MDRTVVLLTASWCPRCPVARRLWEELRERYGLDYQELDIDGPEGQEVAARYAVEAVPAVIVNGKILGEVFAETEALRALDARDTEAQSRAFAR